MTTPNVFEMDYYERKRWCEKAESEREDLEYQVRQARQDAEASAERYRSAQEEAARYSHNAREEYDELEAVLMDQADQFQRVFNALVALVGVKKAEAIADGEEARG